MKPGEGFGETLRAARHQAGLSQKELAARSGVPKTRLSRYENGHILPSLPTLEKLARALGVTESSLLGEQNGSAQLLLAALQDVGVTIRTPADAAAVAQAAVQILRR